MLAAKLATRLSPPWAAKTVVKPLVCVCMWDKTSDTEPTCQTSSRTLTDTHGLEVVLGVGDRWTVTSAISAAAGAAAAAQTSFTPDSEAPGRRTLF